MHKALQQGTREAEFEHIDAEGGRVGAASAASPSSLCIHRARLAARVHRCLPLPSRSCRALAHDLNP